MPIRTRADMHIGLDLALEVLDATPMNRLDPPIKDYFLNRTISEYVKNVVAKANEPDEAKRVPFRLLTHGDIVSKYNNLYTLIKIDDTLLPLTQIDNNFYQYTLPSDLFRFETSFANVRPIDCILYPSAGAPTLAAAAGTGVDIGLHYYFVTFVYSTVETDINGINVSSITIAAPNGYVNLTNLPVGATGCTARKIYRSRVGEAWYRGRLLTTISDNTTLTFQDTIADSALGALYIGNSHDTEITNPLLQTYDIISFNNNPYGGKRKYIGTILETNGLRLYHLDRYAISKVGVIYIKKPAILTSSPGVVNCDLPESVHDKIVDDTAKFIAAATTSGNYQQLLMEAKKQNQ